MNKHSLNIEVLEPLLLMSASGVEVDLLDATAESGELDLGDAAGTLFAEAGAGAPGSPGDINFLIGDSAAIASIGATNEAPEPVVYAGNRADYVVEHQGFGIFSVQSESGTDLLTDNQTLSFDDGAFALDELAGIEPADSEEAADLPPETNDVGVEAESNLTLAPEDWFAEDTQSVYSYDIDSPPGSDRAGDIQKVSTTFNESTNELTFRLVITDADGDAETNGFTLALNDGPNPKGHGDELALFYFDGSGSEPVVSAYNYNGQNDFTSYLETPLVSSAGADSPFTSIELSVDADGNQVYSFSLDATSIVEHSDGADWTGVEFSDSLGIWLHPMTNLSTSYGDDGFLESWSFDDHGWFDTKDQVTTEVIIDVSPPAPTVPPTDGDDGLQPVDEAVTHCAPPEPENTAPDAQDDFETVEGVPLNGSVAGNDSDADGDDLTFYINEGPTNGSIEFSDDGSYTYTPDPGFSGEDTFTYEAADGQGGSSIATVTLTVEAIANQAPDAADDINTTVENEAVSGSVAGNDSDADGDDLTFYVNEGPTNGSIEFSDDGSYTYTPNPGYSGTDSFTYEAFDGIDGSTIATVTITVDPAPNQAPDAVEDYGHADYNTAFTGHVLCNDVDPDSDTLTVVTNTPPVNGTVTVSANGDYTYTPNDGFSGEDTFTYTISDGNGGTDTATVTICVGPPPVVNGVPDAVNDAESTAYETAIDGNVLPNDSDPDGDSLTVSLTEGTSNGSVTLFSDGSYSYTPNDGFTGQDTFTYQVNDGNGGTDTATVTIDVGPAPVVNSVPDAVDDAESTAHETAIDGNVLPNDSDPDGDSLTVSLVQGSENGSVTLNSDGSYSYTPNDGFTGQDTFTYQVNDGNGGTDTATVTIDVGPASVVGGESNDRNTIDATDDNYATEQDTAFSGNVLDNDLDPDGDTLTTTELTDVRTSEGGTVSLFSDGSFNYTPAAGFTGNDTFVYESSDGNGNVTTANVTITVSDATLLAVDDGFAGNFNQAISDSVINNDVGVDDDVQVNLITGPVNGTLTLNSDGTFTYQPNDGFSGADTFRYTLVDGASTSQASVRLVVGEVQYDTTYVGGERDGYIWGDPHFRGDDGGLFDVQGRANHTYSLLSDVDLQLNAKFIHWEGVEQDGTVIGEIGLVMGDDRLYIDLNGGTLNGIDLAIGQSTIGNGTVDYDGTAATINTGEYILTLTREDGLFSVRLNAIDPFSDVVAPHGLWGQTVDGDRDARDGDFYRDNFDYGLQGGGAIDTLDADGNVVRSERGDQTGFELYETLGLFSTTALRAEGDAFFRFDAERGTGLTTL